MIEYKVIDVDGFYPDVIQNVLNSYAKERWRVITVYSTCIILEREVIEESTVPKNSTYSWEEKL